MRSTRTYTKAQIAAARKKAAKGGWSLQKVSGDPYKVVRAKPAKKPTQRGQNGRSKIKTGKGEFFSARNVYAVEGVRKFSGKPYRLTADAPVYYTKSDAQSRAATIRKQGKSVRVVELPRRQRPSMKAKYALYVR